MEEKLKQKNSTLHKYLFTVTTFSKLLALFMFIIFPLGGFYLGMKYQEKITVTPLVVSEIQKNITPTNTSDNTNLTNPASVYCKEQGGENKIITAPDGSQSGQCTFPDGRKCDDWQFFRTKICK